MFLIWEVLHSTRIYTTRWFTKEALDNIHRHRQYADDQSLHVSPKAELGQATKNRQSPGYEQGRFCRCAFKLNLYVLYIRGVSTTIATAIGPGAAEGPHQGGSVQRQPKLMFRPNSVHFSALKSSNSMYPTLNRRSPPLGELR